MSVPTNSPLNVKLRCKSWAQVQHLYERDIKNGTLFLKSSKHAPVGTRFQINLLLPSESTVVLLGQVAELVAVGGYGGRGPGFHLRLDAVSQTTTWLIESSLAAAVKSGALAPSPAADGEESDDHLDQAEDELVATLESELATLRKLNPFQLLEVGYDADDDGVRQAFGTLTKRYHPDRFARYQSPRATALGAEIYLLLRDAYAALSSPAARAQTLTRVRGAHDDPGAAPATRDVASPRAATPPPAPPPVPPPVAKASAPPARSPLDELLDAGKIDEALELARAARKRTPDAPEARAAVELCEGLKALAEGNRMEAAERLELTAELDPTNERAVRALAEIRRLATEERKGFLARLLNQKG